MPALSGGEASSTRRGHRSWKKIFLLNWDSNYKSHENDKSLCGDRLANSFNLIVRPREEMNSRSHVFYSMDFSQLLIDSQLRMFPTTSLDVMLNEPTHGGRSSALPAYVRRSCWSALALDRD